MICHKPFLVGAGRLPEGQMFFGCSALARTWGLELIQFSCCKNPNEVFDSLPLAAGLVELIGDPAMKGVDGSSWLEALGDWCHPTILMTSPTESGEISGAAPAYVALCKEYSVPLLGIVQLGGSWQSSFRRGDGLPWCGWVPADRIDGGKEDVDSYNKQDSLLEDVVFNLQRRMIYLNYS